jgi:phosphonate transport system substrate-binding protein
VRTLTLVTGPVHLDADGERLRQRLALLLVDVLRRPVAVVASRTYAEVTEKLERGEAQLAWMPPALFVRAEARMRLTLLAAIDRAHGAGYRGVLFVPADSAARAPGELAEQRVAWVDPDSCAGHLFVRLALLGQGLTPGALFREERFLGSHGAVVRAVMRGEADAGATHAQLGPDGGLLLAGWQAYAGRDAMRALLVTDPIPADVVCASPALDVDALDDVREALLHLHESASDGDLLSELFGGPRLVPASTVDYDPVRSALEDFAGSERTPGQGVG